MDGITLKTKVHSHLLAESFLNLNQIPSILVCLICYILSGVANALYLLFYFNFTIKILVVIGYSVFSSIIHIKKIKERNVHILSIYKNCLLDLTNSVKCSFIPF